MRLGSALSRSFLTTAVLALAPLAGEARAQLRKLNGLLEFNYASSVGANYQIVPGGRIVYAGLDLDGNGHDALLSAPFAAGGPTIELTPLPGGYNDGVFYVTPTPDGARILYQSDQAGDGKYELYSVPSDGSAPPVQLHPPFVGTNYLYSFLLAPDGSRVAYTQSEQGSFRLYSVLPDGSQPPIALAPGLAASGISITSDSSHVVFLGPGFFELYSVPLGGGAAPRQLSTNPGSNRRVQAVTLSPDGQWVVFKVGRDSDFVFELYSVPVDGSLPPTKLNGTLPVYGGDYLIAPESTHVTYIRNTEWVIQRVPIQGGASVQLTPTASAAVIKHWVTPDGSRIVYQADYDTPGLYELYSSPTDGSQAAVKVSGDLGEVSGYPSFWMAPDSSRVLFGKHHASSVWELYSSPLDGSTAPVRLHAALGSNRSVDIVQLPAGTGCVVFRISRYTGSSWVDGQLYSAPLDGSVPEIRLNTNRSGSDLTNVSGLQADPASGAVLYRADQEIDDLMELYRVPLDGSAVGVVCSDVRDAIDVTGDVNACWPSPDGQTFVYHARQETGQGLYAVPLDGSEAPTLLTLRSAPGSLVIGPDSRRAVYDKDFGFYQPENELFSVPLDASAPAVTLSPMPLFGSVGKYAFTPDSSHVLFTYEKHDESGSLLYSVPADGSGPELELTGWEEGSVEKFEVRSDSRSVVFLGGPGLGASELYFVRVNGSHAPRRLNPALPLNGFVTDFALSPDGGHVVYRADAEHAGKIELYAVRIGLPLADGRPGWSRRAGPEWPREVTKLSAPLDLAGDVDRFRISPDSACVVYLADQRVDEVDELFVVPIDGNSAPVCLAAADSAKDVHSFLIAPDSSRVVVRGDLDVDEQLELYGVPIGGGIVPTRLNPAPVSGGDVHSFQIASDSAHVVFLGNLEVGSRLELYSAPLDGGSPAHELNPPLDQGGNVFTLVQLDPSANWVLFSADVSADQVYDIYVVPIDASLAPRQINGPFLGSNSAFARGFTPAGGHAFFRAPQETPGAIELYVEDL